MTEYAKLLKAGAHVRHAPLLPQITRDYLRASATRIGLFYEPTSQVERNAKELRSIVAGAKQ
jgi:hypothetical protein